MALSLLKQNLPCEVHFAGWRSDTCTLGRSGWQVSFEEDVCRGELVLLLHLKSAQLTCYATARDRFRTMEWRHQGQMEDRLPVFVVQQAASRFTVRTMEMPKFGAWAGTDPSFSMVEEYDLYHTPLFTSAVAAAGEELIVDPATVSELLEQIRQQQAPDQAAIRKRDRSRERPLLHAKIFTFPDMVELERKAA